MSVSTGLYPKLDLLTANKLHYITLHYITLHCWAKSKQQESFVKESVWVQDEF
jgi:hypothetical protein